MKFISMKKLALFAMFFGVFAINASDKAEAGDLIKEYNDLQDVKVHAEKSDSAILTKQIAPFINRLFKLNDSKDAGVKKVANAIIKEFAGHVLIFKERKALVDAIMNTRGLGLPYVQYIYDLNAKVLGGQPLLVLAAGNMPYLNQGATDQINLDNDLIVISEILKLSKPEAGVKALAIQHINNAIPGSIGNTKAALQQASTLLK